MKAYEGLKPWSLFSNLNGFIHELIGPWTNNVFVDNLGLNNNQEMFKFSISGFKIFFVATLSLKWA
jgi:hypothetical protein